MFIFIDSVVWIGAKLKRDQRHDKSVSIIMEKVIGKVKERKKIRKDELITWGKLIY